MMRFLGHFTYRNFSAPYQQMPVAGCPHCPALTRRSCSGGFPNNRSCPTRLHRPMVAVGVGRRIEMADNLNNRGSPDSKTINMNEKWEKQY
jgi:hypothetical protein